MIPRGRKFYDRGNAVFHKYYRACSAVSIYWTINAM